MTTKDDIERTETLLKLYRRLDRLEEQLAHIEGRDSGVIRDRIAVARTEIDRITGTRVV